MTEFVEMPLLPDSDAGHGGRFVYGVAESVKGAFESAASRVLEHSGSRGPLVTGAGEDFRGHFSEVFAANAATASRDAESLAAALRTVAGYVGTMISEAREEDDRRRQNNEWVRWHNNRNWLGQQVVSREPPITSVNAFRREAPGQPKDCWVAQLEVPPRVSSAGH
ncbi:hypothetical protein [Arthrobacter sp. D5-1]|uniref:hypothetical protein n=1 Tax=Arthrobacter sp. D5-1 TaxID=1477518 RepID=UPI001A9859BC|nr:hypothetical protein [Arthrobacter sp. D5-1]